MSSEHELEDGAKVVGKSGDRPANEEHSGWSPDIHRRKLVVGIGVLVVAVLAVLFAWNLPPFDWGDETTNNAYVRGRTTVISPQVTGYLAEVPVTDFQRVSKGDVLAQIEDTPFRDKLEQGEASTAAQRANLANYGQSLSQAKAQLRLQDASVVSARAALQRVQADMDRVAELVGEGWVSLRERDRTFADLQQAQAAVRQAQAQRAIAAEQVRSVEVGKAALEAQVAGADASTDLARFQLSQTKIRAPRDGRLSEVTARVGQLVNPGTQLMYIVPDDLWVIANFKETQTADMRVGQRTTLEVDALGGVELTGRVQSIAPAASNEFSLVRPDTGAGNFVKVPQRIAVRIVIDNGQEMAGRLGPGMSVIATVHTRE